MKESKNKLWTRILTFLKIIVVLIVGTFAYCLIAQQFHGVSLKMESKDGEIWITLKKKGITQAIVDFEIAKNNPLEYVWELNMSQATQKRISSFKYGTVPEGMKQDLPLNNEKPEKLAEGVYHIWIQSMYDHMLPPIYTSDDQIFRVEIHPDGLIEIEETHEFIQWPPKEE